MGKPVKVEIVLEDTEAKADTCTNVYRKFIDDYDCTAIVGPNESSSAPVSYTHLDVYKRQIL